jgi:hypothetical protein
VNQELLTAIQSLLGYVKQLEEIVFPPDDPGIHQAVLTARAAIKKAEGQA